MCPSYRATLDERHSTRGRANAIRLAVTGQTGRRPSSGRAAVGRPGGLKETLDLCLSCKACKTECPSNVDVAQLKSEYLGQRLPPSRRAVAGEAFLECADAQPHRDRRCQDWPIGSVVCAPVRAVLNRVMGLAPSGACRRSLHRSAVVPVATRRRRPGRPRVAVLADCFVTYSEPHIGQGGRGGFGALGYGVDLPEAGCCGRPMISSRPARPSRPRRSTARWRCCAR